MPAVMIARIGCLIVVLLLACEERGVRTSASAVPVNSPTCPPDSCVEHIHAAAYFFEHGSSATARTHLSSAHALMPKRVDPVTTSFLSRLDALSRDIDQDPDRVKNQIEQMREEFSEWPCLSEDAHARFHGKLPPLP